MHHSGETAPRKSLQCPEPVTFRALMQFFAPFTGMRTVCPSKKILQKPCIRAKI